MFIHDPETGCFTLQTDLSYPPDGSPPIVPTTGAGPGEGEKSSSNLSSSSTLPTDSDLCLDVLGGSTEDGPVLTPAEYGGGDNQ